MLIENRWFDAGQPLLNVVDKKKWFRNRSTASQSNSSPLITPEIALFEIETGHANPVVHGQIRPACTNHYSRRPPYQA
jgi:hypothetical protein